MRIVAVVPVKSKSERVASKNFRDFHDGKSLFDLLISKLTASNLINQIYISTNELSIQKNSSDHGCKFLHRDERFCNNDTAWSEVITHVIDSLPEANDVLVLWCHTTSPLFDRYDEAIEKYLEMRDTAGNDGLITVSRLSEFIVTENKQPLNYSWGVWHPYSQNLEKMYSITGALFVATKDEMLRNRYVISRNPHLFETTPYESIDIDTLFDFELAKLMIQNKEKLI